MKVEYVSESIEIAPSKIVGEIEVFVGGGYEVLSISLSAADAIRVRNAIDAEITAIKKKAKELTEEINNAERIK